MHTSTTGWHLNQVLLFLCDWLKIREIYKLGGAQAVAVMATAVKA